MVFPLPSAAWATAQDRVPIINRPTEEHTDASAEPMPGKLQRLVERPLHHSEFLMPFSCLIGNSIFYVTFGRHIIILKPILSFRSKKTNCFGDLCRKLGFLNWILLFFSSLLFVGSADFTPTPSAISITFKPFSES
jgi:hypothetical protein